MARFVEWLFLEGDRDPATIRARVVARPDFIEALVVGSIVLILLLASPYDSSGIDWEIFAGAADGEFISDRGLGYYYAYWFLPLFDLFALAGLTVGGLLWSLLNVGGAWFAARVFGARPAVVLAGFGTLSGFYTGTITGVAVAALAGMWWAAHEERWTLVGVLSVVAVAKPQWGLVVGSLIVAQARPPLRAWPRLIVGPAIAVGASLAAYGWWPGDVFDRIDALPPEGNGSLWHFLGPAVIVLWLAVLVPMDPRRRLAVAAACALMAVPYVQQYDYLLLWVLVADGVGLFSHSFGMLSTAFGEEGARGFQTLMPLVTYAYLVVPPVREWFARRDGLGTGSGLGQPA